MKRMQTIEIKNRNVDQLGKDLQKMMDGLDSKVSNMEKTVKKLTYQNYSILKTVADNFNTLLNKLEQSKGQDSHFVNEDQGTRANSKKSEGVEVKKVR